MKGLTEYLSCKKLARRGLMGVGLAATIMLLPPITSISAQEAVPTYTVLYNFTGRAGDGADPFAGLVVDTAGSLYGTTVEGGANGLGVVFKLDPEGNETVLHTFTGSADGWEPDAPLILDAAGNLYGTTVEGGADGYGVVFKLDPEGNETVLHAFTGAPDGVAPLGLVRDAAGNVYGITNEGGTNGRGVVFKVDTAGNETVLHSFTGVPDGAYPNGGLTMDAAGNLYGTTYYGGADNVGAVFKLDTAGNETVIYSFTRGADGGSPYAGLILDAAGNLYGTTYYGGDHGYGVVFKLDPSGAETVLYNFMGRGDGKNPRAALIRDAAGNLYGTTETGGADHGFGVVFELDPSGNEKVLHSFTGGTDGGLADSGLLYYKGSLYGTTAFGGDRRRGVVFKIQLH